MLPESRDYGRSTEEKTARLRNTILSRNFY